MSIEDTTTRPLVGMPLRYLLTYLLHRSGPVDVAELVRQVEAEGHVLPGRPSKAISDALRWEVRKGRVVRLGRGLYGPGTVPRSTMYRISRWVEAVRGQRPWWPLP